MTTTYSAVDKKAINDLTEKFPAGPRGRLTKKHYIERREYVDTYARTAPIQQLMEGLSEFYAAPGTERSFGYDPVFLFKLKIRDEKDAIKSIEAALVGGDDPSIKACKRRGRRLWSRLSDIVSRVRREGTEGIWTARYREADYSTTLNWGIALYAKNKADAESQIALIAPMMGVQTHWRPTVTFDDCGTAADVFARNTTALNRRVDGLKQDVARYEKDLAAKRLALAAETKITGDIMSAIMLGLSTEEEEEETHA